jgi:hypothetical protein
VRFAAFQSFVCNRLVAIWFATPAASLVVSDGDQCGFYRLPSPRLLAQASSSSRKLHAPSESSRHMPAPRLPAWSAFPGVHLPSSRRQPAASLRRGPNPTAFRPRRFSRPRRFDPPPALRVYFTPQPRPGFTPKRIALAQPRRFVTASCCPLVVLRQPATSSCPLAPRTDAPPSGLFSVREFRYPGYGV